MVAQTDERLYQPADVARELGISVQSLYNFERRGYFAPPRRTIAGDRIFFPEDLDRIKEWHRGWVAARSPQWAPPQDAA